MKTFPGQEGLNPLLGPQRGRNGDSLGKSSLLQAGAFPQLREADYLRLDHSVDPADVARVSRPVGSDNTGQETRATLADQVKAALVEAFTSDHPYLFQRPLKRGAGDVDPVLHGGSLAPWTLFSSARALRRECR